MFHGNIKRSIPDTGRLITRIWILCDFSEVISYSVQDLNNTWLHGTKVVASGVALALPHPQQTFFDKVFLGT